MNFSSPLMMKAFCETTPSSLKQKRCFPYGCPEPVLANVTRISVTNGAQGTFFLTCISVQTWRFVAVSPIPIRLRKRHSFLSLCLSRACLGTLMHFIYKWRKRWRFSHRCITSPIRRAFSGSSVRKRKTHHSSLKFSLLRSRACLGKMIVFSIKWHRKRYLFSQLFLCLSRACLGKMIVFSIK